MIVSWLAGVRRQSIQTIRARPVVATMRLGLRESDLSVAGGIRAANGALEDPWDSLGAARSCPSPCTWAYATANGPTATPERCRPLTDQRLLRWAAAGGSELPGKRPDGMVHPTDGVIQRGTIMWKHLLVPAMCVLRMVGAAPPLDRNGTPRSLASTRSCRAPCTSWQSMQRVAARMALARIPSAHTCIAA